VSAEKKLKKKIRSQQRLMTKATRVIEAATLNNEAMQARNDFWRNLMVASAFARGLGNERCIAEIIEECIPQLVGINTPRVPGHVPNRADAQTMATL
jgi:hypothetical protein